MIVEPHPYGLLYTGVQAFTSSYQILQVLRISFPTSLVCVFVRLSVYQIQQQQQQQQQISNNTIIQK